MKKIYTLLMLLVAFLPSFAEIYTIETGQFEKLKINGNISVVYRNLPDSTGMARYEAPADNGDFFAFSTKNEGSLKVEPSDEKWGDENLPVLYVYSDFLTNVESYSDKNVDIESLAPCATFNVTQVGNGTITVDNIKTNNLSASITTGNGSIFLSGVCLNANYRMVGAGLISADRLKARNVKCRILGTGSIGCWPEENLKVTGLGSTKIYYKGKPDIKKKGGGKLFELPEDIDEEEYAAIGKPVKVSIEEKYENAVPSPESSNNDDTPSQQVNTSNKDEDNPETEDVDDEEEEEVEEEEENQEVTVDEDDDYQTVVTDDDEDD